MGESSECEKEEMDEMAKCLDVDDDSLGINDAPRGDGGISVTSQSFENPSLPMPWLFQRNSDYSCMEGSPWEKPHRCSVSVSRLGRPSNVKKGTLNQCEPGWKMVRVDDQEIQSGFRCRFKAKSDELGDYEYDGTCDCSKEDCECYNDVPVWKDENKADECCTNWDDTCTGDELLFKSNNALADEKAYCKLHEVKLEVKIDDSSLRDTPVKTDCESCTERFGPWACTVPATPENSETCIISANQNLCEKQGPYSKWCAAESEKLTCGDPDTDPTCSDTNLAGMCMARLPDSVDCRGHTGCHANGQYNCVYCVYAQEKCKDPYHCRHMFHCDEPPKNMSLLV